MAMRYAAVLNHGYNTKRIDRSNLFNQTLTKKKSEHSHQIKYTEKTVIASGKH
jgi:hypothetical protein